MPRHAVERTTKRAERAWSKKRRYYSDWYEVGRYFRPGTDPYRTGRGGPESGMRGSASTTNRYAHLYDATGMESCANHADMLAATLFPPGRRWAKLGVGPLFAQDAPDDDRTDLLETIEEKVFEGIHASNFVLAVNSMIYDAVSYGTGVMKGGISADTSTLLQWDAVSQSQVAFEMGPRGEVWGFFRKLDLEAEEIRVMWPEAKAVPEDEQDERNEPKLWPVLEATYYGPDTGVWYYDVILRKTDKGEGNTLIYQRDYVVCPWIVWRYRLAPEEVQGQSPAMAALPDVRTCNEAVRVRLQSASLRVAGMWTYRAEDAFNPLTVYPESGAFLPVGSNDSANPTIRELPLPGDPQFGELVLEDHRSSVRSKFNDDALPDPTGPVRSPTEYLERRREREQKQGMPYIRLVEEVARPVLRLSSYLMAEAGQIPELAAVQPASEAGTPMPLMLNGKDVGVEFRHPLTIAQELSDAENIVRWSESSQQSAGPEAWLAGAHTENIPAELGRLMSIPGAPDEPQTLVRSEQDRQEREQAAMEARLAQPAGGGGAQLNENAMLQANQGRNLPAGLM